MTATLDTTWVGEVAAAYRAGRPVALLFDYDGTLTPLVRHPSLARLPHPTRSRLARLAALPRVAVGVLSGRALDDVRAAVGLDAICYAGSGGLEVDLGGDRVGFAGGAAFRAAAARVEADLAPVVVRFPGTWVERKPLALALHYRELPPAAAVRFQSETAAVLDRFPAVRYRTVSAAVEVTPAGGWDKGTAVELILDRYGPDVFPVYVGDAANDAEAMAVTALAGGIAVGVGPDAPAAATHRAVSVAELSGWLGRLERALDRSAGPQPDDFHFDPGAGPEAGDGTAGGTEAGASGPGLLLLDPDAAFRAEFAAAFAGLGWRVWAAADAEAAATTLRQHAGEVRAAVVDLQLPGLQGARVLAEIGRAHPDVVRCALSIDVSGYAVAAYRRMTELPLLTKPVDFRRASDTLRWLTGADDRTEPPADGPG